MKFNLESTVVLRFQKNGHVLIKDVLVYRNEEFSIFGITEIIKNNNSFWALVHIPSEEVIISVFKTKTEVENYWDFLARAVDLNSLFLCSPKFESIDEQLRYDVEISYKKYLINKDLNL